MNIKVNIIEGEKEVVGQYTFVNKKKKNGKIEKATLIHIEDGFGYVVVGKSIKKVNLNLIEIE